MSAEVAQIGPVQQEVRSLQEICSGVLVTELRKTGQSSTLLSLYSYAKSSGNAELHREVKLIAAERYAYLLETFGPETLANCFGDDYEGLKKRHEDRLAAEAFLSRKVSSFPHCFP